MTDCGIWLEQLSGMELERQYYLALPAGLEPKSCNGKLLFGHFVFKLGDSQIIIFLFDLMLKLLEVFIQMLVSSVS